jgi:predicted nuclease with TOPRIM domain
MSPISHAFEEPFDDICKELMEICRRLECLLPDPTLSPLERLERLARVAPHSVLQSEHHRTARSKLNSLRHRINDLVPSPQLSSLEKIEFLVSRTHQLVPEPMEKFFMKLEKLGDRRPSDIGR